MKNKRGGRRREYPPLREERYVHRLWTLERILVEIGCSKAVTRTVLGNYGIASTALSEEPTSGAG